MLWWAASAAAHGPAPAVLEVLSWQDGTCAAAVPALVRTNVGLMLDGEEGYHYGCPARWGEAEQALAAVSSGRLLLAGAGGVFLSSDGGCTAARLPIGPEETPVVARGGAALWLVTRNFERGEGSLWRIDGEPALIDRASDRIADGLVLDALGEGWMAGAVPLPNLARLRAGRVEEVVPAWPELEVRLDRLTPRLVDGQGVWLLAGSGSTRRLWWTDGAQVVTGPGPAEAVHGPARLGERLLAVLDGGLWVAESGTWSRSEHTVDWTCLQDTPHGPLACQLDRASLVTGLDEGGVRTEGVIDLEQLGPPEPDCPDPVGTCALDWLHYGGESGWIDSEPAVCPGESRTPMVEQDPADQPGAPACGCAYGGAIGVWPLLWWRRRTIPSSAGGAGGIRQRRSICLTGCRGEGTHSSERTTIGGLAAGRRGRFNIFR